MKLLVGSLWLLLGVRVLGAEPECKRSPKLVGACFVIHGRADSGDGTPSLRIWRIGTKHKYGVFPDEDHGNVAPNPVLDNLDTLNNSVYGDFEVCPFTRERARAMTMVCVEEVKHLVVVPH
jgi:hypothetical protein